MSDDDSPSKLSFLNRLKRRVRRKHIDTEEDIQDLMSVAQDKQLIDDEAAKMIEGVMTISKMCVSDVMIPRSQMVVLERGKHLSDLLPIIIESSHSRFPVIEESDRNSVLGILLAKDLLKYYARHEFDDLVLEAHFLRPAVFVPETKRLDALLKEFRLSHNHLAIVVDEYGSVSGVVTIEDVLEQIVGDIEDEFDTDPDDNGIIPMGGDQYEISALTLIEDFNDHFQTQYPDDRVDTIGGLIMQHLGYVPHKGEHFKLDQFDFEVIAADDRHILKCIMTVSEQSS